MYRCLLGEKVSIFCFAQVSCCQVKDRNAFLKSASEYKGLKIWCCLFHLKNSKCFPKWLINRPVLCEAGSVCWAPALGMKTKLNQRKINSLDESEAGRFLQPKQNWYTWHFKLNSFQSRAAPGFSVTRRHTFSDDRPMLEWSGDDYGLFHRWD